MPTSHETMTCHPTEPVIRHVLVSRYPGLVINWQYTPVHNATAPSWTALVLVAPFPEAILVEHVSTDRLVGVRDPSPADGRGHP